jgi:hypothetical protein
MWTLINLMVSVAVAAPGDLQSRVDALLAQRHEASCSQLAALGPRDAVRGALVVASTTEMPPWAPLRAVGCLTEWSIDPVARAEVVRLVKQPDQPGFALVVAEKLAGLPAEPAFELASAVRARAVSDVRLQRLVMPRLAASVHEPVRALVSSPTP